MMIAMLDSGVGGLAILAELHKVAPEVPVLYVADVVYAPYGERTAEEILARVEQIVRWFIARDCRVIVLACNTATVYAIDQMRQRFPEIVFIGTEPAIKPAAAAVSKILVLGTNATVRNGRYQRLAARYAGGKRVWAVGAPELVSQVEQGDFTSSAQLRARIDPFISQGLEGVVIGCTHFSFLVPLIQQTWPSLRVFDGREGVARQILQRLPETLPSWPSRFVMTAAVQGLMPLEHYASFEVQRI